ncbi:alpha/beta hydrolase [Chungangia koreensis]|uniref:Alpha/beta hydrolase n=1 Tax=Chungangia koreensis TaxID=752657 RepID=A0ABV8X2B7_9LACT
MWKWEAEGQPKAVVAIVHSAYEHHRRYAWLIERFRTAGFHVVMGDLPGHGDASLSHAAHDSSFEEYEKFVHELVKVGLSHNLPLFVIGHGMGATLMMNKLHSKELSIAGVVLSSPWLHLVQTPPKTLTGIGKIATNMKIKHDLPIKQMTRNFDVYKLEKDDPLYNPVITSSWYSELQGLMRTTFQTKGQEISMPVLMHTAERDKITDPRYALRWMQSQQMREFQYREWKNCYHDLFQEPEREYIFLYTEAFMNNTLRSLGYIV